MSHPPTPSPMDAPASVVFTTEGLSAAERLEAWNAAFGSLNQITIPRDVAEPVSVHSENWLLGGGLVLSETKVSRASFCRDRLRVRRDQLDHWVLRVLRNGTGRLQHPGFQTITRPGDLILFSMDDTWTAQWDGDVDWVSVSIPRDLDLRLSSSLAQLPRGVLHGVGADLLRDILLRLPALVAIAKTHELAGLASVLLAAVCAGVGGAKPSAPCVPESTTPLAKDRVRRVILRHVKSRLTPAILASEAGISRSALYRLLECEGGVARYIRQTRLSLAHAALVDPTMASQSIAAIGEAHGFPDPPEFSRAFRSYFGVSPREARSAGMASETFIPPLLRGERPGHHDVATKIYASVRL